MSEQNNLPNTCEVDSSCVVVVDMQDRLAMAMPHKVIRRMERNAMMLLNAASELKVPVVATLQYPKGLGQILAPVEENLPAQTMKIEKTRFSCCGVPEFDEFIKAVNRPQVILFGIEMHICVMQTALDLQRAGYQPWVVLDATGSRQRDSYDYSMTRFKACNINITETEAVLFEWMRDATHPSFKEISATLR